MRAFNRGQVRHTTAALLGIVGLLVAIPASVARSDEGLLGNFWSDDQSVASSPGIEDSGSLIDIRVNALFLNRRPPRSNIVLTETATGKTLLNTSENDPSWAGGVETNLFINFSDATTFEFDWFQVDDWFDRQSVAFAPTAVDQVPFLVTDAFVSVSTRVRNMEFNLREKVYDGVTILGGFRYIDLNDNQGVHYQNKPFGASEVIVTDVANRLYGFQIGTQLDLWTTETFELSTWGKVGVYGNAASNSTGIFSTIPANAQNIRAQDGKTAFAGEFGVRATRHFGEYASVFVGYRLLYLDGIALAGGQYAGTLKYLDNGVPTIRMGDSMLFQGIEAGLAFHF